MIEISGGTTVGEEGRKRRLGFGKKGKTFTVHRSEEIFPEDIKEQMQMGMQMQRPLIMATSTLKVAGKQTSSASSDGEGSGDGDRSDFSLSDRLDYRRRRRKIGGNSAIFVEEDLIELFKVQKVQSGIYKFYKFWMNLSRIFENQACKNVRNC